MMLMGMVMWRCGDAGFDGVMVMLRILCKRGRRSCVDDINGDGDVEMW